jgi:uncharacterized membrane protein
MVTAHFDDRIREGQIVLRPNQSWTWRSNTYFVATLLAVSTAIAASFAMRGYWLVLPFSALEMAALFGCLYFCVRRASQQEVLTFSVDELVVEKGHQRPEHIYRYPRFFARFQVEAPQHPWYRPRIAIVVRNERLEIGQFLGAEEKKDLIGHLRHMIHQFA